MPTTFGKRYVGGSGDWMAMGDAHGCQGYRFGKVKPGRWNIRDKSGRYTKKAQA